MIGTLLFSLLLQVSPQQGPVVVHQVTTGWCSPAISNVIGNVTVNCKGVDPRALVRLNERLRRAKLDRVNALQIANDWADQYHQLEKRLAEAGDDSELSRKAEEYLHQGDLEKAGAILDQILGSEDPRIDRTAANHYNRGLVFELQFQPLDALPHYQKAYKLEEANQHPSEQVKYGEEYVYLLLRQNDFEHAEPVLQAILESARGLVKVNRAYQPDATRALNYLSILYFRTGRTKEAEDADREALKSYRELAKTNPEAYQPYIAILLNNLAIVYGETERIPEAEKAYGEALEIRRQLAKTNPDVYQSDVARTLNNLGILYDATNRFKEAGLAYIEVLEIRRPLAKANPAAYDQDLADTLNNLGSLCYHAHLLKPAEDAYSEALEIRRQLVLANPAANEPDLARTLDSLAELYRETGRSKEAETAYLEASEIFRRPEVNRRAYDPNLAQTLSNLAALYDEMKRPKEAETTFQEALKMNRELAKLNPAANQADLGKTLSNLGVFYSRTDRSKEAEAAHLEALEIFRELAKSSPSVHQPFVATALDNLGILYFHMDGRIKDAGGAYQQELEVRRNLAKADPARHQSELVHTLDQVALFDAMTVGRNVPRAQQEVEEAVRITRENWKVDPDSGGNPLARSLIVAVQVGIFTDQPPATICSFAREAASVSRSPELRQETEELMTESCKAQ